MDEVFRILFAILAAGGLIGMFAVTGRVRAGRRAASVGLAERFGLPPGQSAVIYLLDDGGHAPPVEPLIATRRVVVHRLRADRDPELVRSLNIATLPSTIVIGPDHAVRRISPGMTDPEAIEDQLA